MTRVSPAVGLSTDRLIKLHLNMKGTEFCSDFINLIQQLADNKCPFVNIQMIKHGKLFFYYLCLLVAMNLTGVSSPTSVPTNYPEKTSGLCQLYQLSEALHRCGW